MKKVDLCGGSPVIKNTSFDECPNLDHESIIATGKMSFDTFKDFATADITRRIEPMSGDRKTVISNKLDAIPNQIANPDYHGCGKIPQPTQDSLAKIHGLITYWELKEATTIIELAVWRCNMKNENANDESRQLIRTHCGRKIQAIMSGVLQFFDFNIDEE